MFIFSYRNFRLGLCAMAAACVNISPLAFAADNNSVKESVAPEYASLEKIVKGDHRDGNRDEFRHPLQTLQFFEVKPNHAVVEIWPGGGWYTSILAPYLKDEGTLYAAHFDPDSDVEYYQTSLKKFKQMVKDKPDLFGDIVLTSFAPPDKTDIAPPNSADRVLTFRNVHNWSEKGDDQVLDAFNAFYRALKPGGVLGIVEHRLPENRPIEDQGKSGYMKESYVIKLAEQAGFSLIEKSEINANPKDTADHPNGVWTLPPRLRIEKDQEKYKAIGESDRMTLKFIKPVD